MVRRPSLVRVQPFTVPHGHCRAGTCHLRFAEPHHEGRLVVIALGRNSIPILPCLIILAAFGADALWGPQTTFKQVRVELNSFECVKCPSDRGAVFGCIRHPSPFNAGCSAAEILSDRIVTKRHFAKKIACLAVPPLVRRVAHIRAILRRPPGRGLTRIGGE